MDSAEGKPGHGEKKLREEFSRNGFVIVRGLLSPEEAQVLLQVARSDASLAKNKYGLDDGQGATTKLSLWNQPGEDMFGAIARCPRVVSTMELLLGDEVYHYHSKMTMKEPLVGGAFGWHQDYGYWYNNGCLFPDMGSVFIAVDPNTRENGCLQVLKGSQRLGRVEHGRFADQTCADPERVEQAVKHFELVYVELDPGDALFFHSNLLHRSDQNSSPHPRWSLICCYNTKHNNPYKDSHHPMYSPLDRVPDSRVLELGRKALEVGSETNCEASRFLDPDTDKTIRLQKREGS